MLKLTIISLLIIQTSASFFDDFAPMGSSIGRLVTDVATRIGDTIDCTILAVEHVFTLDGLFGSSSDYDERCRGIRAQEAANTNQYYYSTEQTYAPPAISQAKQLSQEIDRSVSDAREQVKTIVENSNAKQKIDDVKITIKGESDRVAQISALLRRELNTIPATVKKKFDLKLEEEHPTINSLLDVVKMLYKVEQIDKSSAEANKVRRSFDRVLHILHNNDTDDTLSDEGEFKEVVRNLGKLSNDSLVDVEKQVAEWTEKQNKQLLRDAISTATTDQPEVLTASQASASASTISDQPNANALPSTTEQKTQTKTTNELPASTQPPSQTKQSVTPQPQSNVLTSQSTQPEFPKTFKDVAKQIYQTTTAAPPEAPLDYDSLFGDSDDPANPNESIINEMFAPQDPKSQIEVVENANKIIQQSQLSSKVLNDFFNDAGRASEPSIFDDPEFESFFS